MGAIEIKAVYEANQCAEEVVVSMFRLILRPVKSTSVRRHFLVVETFFVSCCRCCFDLILHRETSHV